MAEGALLGRRPAGRRPVAGDRGVWRAWVAANAAGEVVGLGSTALVGLALISVFGEAPPLAVAGGLVLAGAGVEGAAIGFAQWFVLRRLFPGMAARAWMAVTALGAGVAWSLGLLPSALMSVAGDGTTGGADPGDAVIYTLAAAMGLGLGVILGLSQWLTLRRHARRPGWWIPANAVAWAVGMPIIFIGVSAVATAGSTVASVAIGGLTLAAAGAVVGAIHGLALLWLAKPGRTGV